MFLWACVSLCGYSLQTSIIKSCNLEVSISDDYTSSASSTPSSLRVSLWVNQCRLLRSHPGSLVMHWQRLSTQQTVGLFSRETDTAVYILHRCFLCPEGPRGGGQPNTNMVSFSHGGLTLFERVIWSHLLFISTMWLFVLGCLCHACFLLCGTSEDDNGSSLSGVSSFQELFFLSDQRFKLCIVYCDRRVSVSVCVCVCDRRPWCSVRGSSGRAWSSSQSPRWSLTWPTKCESSPRSPRSSSLQYTGRKFLQNLSYLLNEFLSFST